MMRMALAFLLVAVHATTPAAPPMSMADRVKQLVEPITASAAGLFGLTASNATHAQEVSFRATVEPVEKTVDQLSQPGHEGDADAMSALLYKRRDPPKAAPASASEHANMLEAWKLESALMEVDEHEDTANLEEALSQKGTPRRRRRRRRMPPDMAAGANAATGKLNGYAASIDARTTSARSTAAQESTQLDSSINSFSALGIAMDNQHVQSEATIEAIDTSIAESAKTVTNMGYGVEELADAFDAAVDDTQGSADTSLDVTKRAIGEANTAMKTDGEYWDRTLENGLRDMKKWNDGVLDDVRKDSENSLEEVEAENEDVKENGKDMNNDQKKEARGVSAMEEALMKLLKEAYGKLEPAFDRTGDDIQSNIVDHADKTYADLDKKLDRSEEDTEKWMQKRIDEQAKSGSKLVSELEKDSEDDYTVAGKMIEKAEDKDAKTSLGLQRELTRNALKLGKEVVMTTEDANGLTVDGKMVYNELKSDHKAQVADIKTQQVMFEQELNDNKANLIPILKELKAQAETKIDAFEAKQKDDNAVEFKELLRNVEAMQSELEVDLSDIQSKNHASLDLVASSIQQAKDLQAPTGQKTRELSGKVRELYAAKTLSDTQLKNAVKQLMALLGATVKKEEQGIKAVADNDSRAMQNAAGVTGNGGVEATVGPKLQDEREESMEALREATGLQKEALDNAKSQAKQEMDQLKGLAQAVQLFGSGAGSAGLWGQIAQLNHVDTANVAKQAMEYNEKINNLLQSLISDVPTRFQETHSAVAREAKVVKAAMKQEFKDLSSAIEKLLDQYTVSDTEDLKEMQNKLKGVNSKSVQNHAVLKAELEQMRQKIESMAETIDRVQEPVQDMMASFQAESQQSIGDSALSVKKLAWMKAIQAVSRVLQQKVLEATTGAKNQLGGDLDQGEKVLEATMEQTQESLSAFLKAGLTSATSYAAMVEEKTDKLATTGEDYKKSVEGVRRTLDEYDSGSRAMANQLELEAANLQRENTKQLGEFENQGAVDIKGINTKLYHELQNLGGKSKDSLEQSDAESDHEIQQLMAEYHKQAAADEHRVETANTIQQSASSKAMTYDVSATNQWEGTMKRFEDQRSDAETEVQTLDRQIDRKQSDNSATDRQASKFDNVNERTDASLSTLGSETDSVSRKAADELSILGNQAESKASIAQVGIESTVATATAKEKMAMQQQEGRDAALSNSVGTHLERIQALGQQADRQRAELLADMNLVKQVAESEDQASEADAKYLTEYDGKARFEVLHSLGHMVKAMVTTAHGVENKFREMDAANYAVETMLEHTMGGEAMQQLMKISKADDLALEVLMDNDEMVQWLADWQNTTTIWRAGVEKAFGDAEIEIELHDQETEESATEARDRNGALAGSMAAKMTALVAGTGGTDAADLIGQNMMDNLATMAAARAAIDGSDAERITDLAAKAGAMTGPPEREIGEGESQLAAIHAQSRHAMGTQQDIEEMLNAAQQKTADLNDENRKNLNLQAQKLNEFLTMGFVDVEDFDKSPSLQQLGAGASAAKAKAAQVKELVQHARQLSAEHARLEAKRQSTGEIIHSLLGQVLGSLHTV